MATDPLAAIHGESPETTGKYVCPYCGNRESFTGIDAHGWGGDDECDGSCGFDPDAVDDSDGAKNYCTCDTVLSQDFTVVDGEGDPDYHAFTGGGDGAEIGAYTTIICGACNTIIWENDNPGDRMIGREYGNLPGEG